MSRTALVSPKQRGANPERLNAQQRAFVHECLADPAFNATDAARRAGYKAPSQAANQLLKQKVIAAILGKAMREREERLQITADQVLIELARIAFANPQIYYNEDGSIKALHSLTPAEAAAIKEIESEITHRGEDSETVTTKYKLHDKVRALELLGRHFSLLNEKVQHEFSGGVRFDFVSLVKQLENQRSNVIDGEFINKAAQ